jgi:hypothetical protein
MLLLGLAGGATAGAQSNTSGTLTIGKDRVDIRYAAAARVGATGKPSDCEAPSGAHRNLHRKNGM